MARWLSVQGVTYRSRVEAEWGIYLKMLGCMAEHEPFFVDGRSTSSGSGPSYLPDFWVPTGGFEPLTGVVLEIKRGRVGAKDLEKWEYLLQRLEAARDEPIGGVRSSGSERTRPTTFARFVVVEGVPPGMWHFAPQSCGDFTGRRITDVWSYGPPPTELLPQSRDAAERARAYVRDHGVDAAKPDQRSSTACELSLWKSKLVAQQQPGC